MNQKLLDYYNRELSWLREMGEEFAERYPKVAGRLAMREGDLSDPYIERLMEGFAFLTSRVQLKMDAEFPRFTQRLLEMIYPNYLAPTPSMAIVEFQPDGIKGNINSGFAIPRGTLIENQAMKSKGVSCKYRTAHDVTLLPLQIAQVELGGIPADLPVAAAALQQRGAIRALRIRLESGRNIPLDQLTVDTLSFYLSGPDGQALGLLELLMGHCVGVLCRSAQQSLLLEPEALRQQGFDAQQALLPDDLRNFSGYRLLQEYFAFPARYLFCDIGGLESFIRSLKGEHQFEILLLLDQENSVLEGVVDSEHLALHCTPVINLFPRVSERINVDELANEYHLAVDNAHPLDYEIYSVEALYGSGRAMRQEQAFRSFWDSRSEDEGNYGAYYAQRREPRNLSDKGKVFGTRTSYVGSELFVSLVDEQQTPYAASLQYLTADLLCTNRDLPLLLRQQGLDVFTLPTSAPVLAIRMRKGPTAPRPALAEGAVSWRLISQLQLNYLSLTEADGHQGATSLRQLLALYADVAEPAISRQIEGLRHCALRPVHRRVPQPGPITFARGVAVELTVDEGAFSGASPWLLGCVLEQLFSRLVAINSFTETTLISEQRGEIGFWPARIGMRPLL